MYHPNRPHGLLAFLSRKSAALRILRGYGWVVVLLTSPLLTSPLLLRAQTAIPPAVLSLLPKTLGVRTTDATGTVYHAGAFVLAGNWLVTDHALVASATSPANLIFEQQGQAAGSTALYISAIRDRNATEDYALLRLSDSAAAAALALPPAEVLPPLGATVYVLNPPGWLPAVSVCQVLRSSAQTGVYQIWLAAPAEPAADGAPVVNAAGQVVGVLRKGSALLAAGSAEPPTQPDTRYYGGGTDVFPIFYLTGRIRQLQPPPPAAAKPLPAMAGPPLPAEVDITTLATPKQTLERLEQVKAQLKQQPASLSLNGAFVQLQLYKAFAFDIPFEPAALLAKLKYVQGLLQDRLKAAPKLPLSGPDSAQLSTVATLAAAGFFTLQKDETAIELILQAVTLNPDNDLALTNAGIFLAENNRALDAVSFLLQALRVNPHNPYTYFYLAYSYYQAYGAAITPEQRQAACRFYRDGLQIEADFDYPVSPQLPSLMDFVEKRCL